MIQRKQSIFLLLAGLAIFALFLFPFVHNVLIGGKLVDIKVDGIYSDISGTPIHTQYFMALNIATAIIGLLPIGLIFLYKNRKQQIALGYSTLLVIIGYSFWMSQTVKKVMGDTQIDSSNWGIGLFLSSVSIVFLLVAVRAIKSDEKLVKSADRLR
jgi:hypothetical protein